MSPGATAGLQDTVTVSPMSSPTPSHASNSAASWTGRGETGEKKRCRGAPDALQQELLAERQKDVARLQDALRLEQENRRHLQSRCSQQAWELKQKERQNSHLKARLVQLLDRPRERKCSMDVLNGPPRLLGKSPPPRAADRQIDQEVALRVMLERQEAELRQALTLRRDLCDLLRLLQTHMEQTFQDSPVAVGVSDCERLIQLEKTLGDHVTGGVVQAWDRVQRRFGELVSQAQSSSSTGTDQEKLLAQLESDLEQSRQLVRLQQQVLQDSVNPPLLPTLTDSYYLEEWERLQAKWAELEDQRRSFQRERQAFTEAAIRLGRERWQFEQQKAIHLAQQILCHSPWDQPTHNRRDSSIGSAHRTYSGCPTASPTSLESGIAPWAEHSLAQTPSTPELYSALRLPFHPRRSRGSPARSDCHERQRGSHGCRSLECSF
ncbi:afadin- and alpha-actinin-binding protein [Brienomyrus brachyistius]|uniref:afadin- and alpha-actinin-binding protein n=1 Tax=Brienomyrus brachyistius TaxID=42636 RepID=UPI0020B18892|nr:afadin- and alpha-actinin-binding protein [Brienomyrus brachyistius]